MPATHNTRSRFLAFVALLALALSGAAGAQNTLGVEPPVKMNDNASRGQTITENVKVANLTNKPVRVLALRSDWDYAESGKIRYLPVGSVKKTASTWITLADNDLVLQPKEVSTLRYSIEVPKDAEDGTYWGIVIFRPEDSDAKPGQLVFDFKVQVSHVFYVNVGTKRSAGKITGLLTRPPATAQSPLATVVKYSNTGNVAQKVTLRLEIRDRSGKVVVKTDFEEDGPAVVLPGRSRVFQVSVWGPLPPGQYVALAIVNYGEKTDVAGELAFQVKTPIPPKP